MIGDTSTDLSNYYTKDDVYSTDEADGLFVTQEEAHADDGVRFINEDEITKLSKLDLTDGNLTISGSVNAGSVIELGETIKKAVTGIPGGFVTTDKDGKPLTINLGIEEGAEKNIIEQIKLNGGDALSVGSTNRDVNINAATSIKLNNNTTPFSVDEDG
jgi:hypothetical protein